MRLAERFRALRHRNFRLFWFGQIVSLTGTWMQSVAQGWLMYRLTESAFLLGLLGVAQFLPILLLALPAGVLADRVDKRRLILTTQVLMMTQAALLAVVTGAGIVQPWMILALAFAFGTVNAFDLPARQSFIVEMVGKEDLPNAIALSSTAFNSARIVGPAIAGVLLAEIGEVGCFASNAISYLAVLYGLVQMTGLPRGDDAAPAHPWERLRDGIRYAVGTGPIRNLLVLLSLMTGFGFQYMVLLPIYAREILRAGETVYGMLVSAFGIGALASAIILTRRLDRPALRRCLLFGLAVSGAGMVVFARSTILPLSLAAGLASGFGLILYVAATNTLVQITTEDRYRGRVMSLYTMLFIGTAPLGSLTMGAVAERTSAPTATTLAGATLLAGAAWVAWRLRQIGRRQAAAVTLPAPETLR